MHQNFIKDYKKSIFSIPKNDFEAFEKKALELFYFQSKYNPVYKEYIDKLNINPLDIDSIYKIPFLPIRFFKSHNVQVESVKTNQIFTSSGTTDQTNQSNRSKHSISDLHFYEQSSQFIFEDLYKEYGKLNDFQIFALLPSYLERDGSSLIYMIDYFLKQAQPNSNYFLYDYEKLKTELEKATKTNPTKPILLLGVTFALLDFADFLIENYPNYKLPKTKQFDNLEEKNEIIVMETGGMKGRKKEMVREEVHQILKTAFGVSAIDSEYGMTELLSQGYALKNTDQNHLKDNHEHTEVWFQTPSYLKIIIRDTNDPFDLKNIEKLNNNIDNLTVQSGAINVIDLANVESCAFIETQDLGKINANGEFQVLGRFDYSDVRGCNLLVI